MQINREMIEKIDEKLRGIGYSMRSGAGNGIYYISSRRQVGLFGGEETYCLIFESEGWRVSVISGRKRVVIEAAIKAVMEKQM